MRNSVRVTLALIAALVVSTSAFAQTDNRVSLNGAVGPSFSNIGTTYSALAGVDVKLNDRVALVGEFGATPHTPFEDAAEMPRRWPDQARSRNRSMPITGTAT